MMLAICFRPEEDDIVEYDDNRKENPSILAGAETSDST
jgi:hypothetical protein